MPLQDVSALLSLSSLCGFVPLTITRASGQVLQVQRSWFQLVKSFAIILLLPLATFYAQFAVFWAMYSGEEGLTWDKITDGDWVADNMRQNGMGWTDMIVIWSFYGSSCYANSVIFYAVAKSAAGFQSLLNKMNNASAAVFVSEAKRRMIKKRNLALIAFLFVLNIFSAIFITFSAGEGMTSFLPPERRKPFYMQMFSLTNFVINYSLWLSPMVLVAQLFLSQFLRCFHAQLEVVRGDVDDTLLLKRRVSEC